MADKEDGTVILLAIEPKYARAILDGSKTVEFRRTWPSRRVAAVVMYASSPEQRIVGYFTVGRVEVSSAKEVWRRHGRKGGLDETAFMAYFAGARRAAAITVASAHRLATPMELNDLGTGGRPPQSFRYLRGEEWQRVRGRKSLSEK